MGVEALTRVFEHAPHDGKPFIILLALADMANAAGVCWPGHIALALYGRVKHQRNLRQYLRLLEETGDLYAAEGRGRLHKAKYLVATAMSAEEICQVLSDVEYFDLPVAKARAIAEAMVQHQHKAQQLFEEEIPLDALRENKRRGSGPRKKGIARSSIEKGIVGSSIEKRIARSSFQDQKRGSPDPKKRIIRSARRKKGDHLIHEQGHFNALERRKLPPDPPPIHDPSWIQHDPPPPEQSETTAIGGGGGPSATTIYLIEQQNINPTTAYELGHLPLDAVKTLCQKKRSAGTREGGIVNALRVLDKQLAAAPLAHSSEDSDTTTLGQKSLEARAAAIAPPEISYLDWQYLLLYLEDGATDDEALQKLRERQADAASSTCLGQKEVP
jgi:hypothetical protein